MPRLRPTRRFRDDEIVVCSESFSSELPVTNTFVRRGQRLRGSDPIVKAHPQRFLRDGALPEEFPTPFDEVIANPPVRDNARPNVVAAIPDEQAAVAIDAFYANGRYVARGERLRRDDPVVLDHLELFKTPMMPLAG